MIKAFTHKDDLKTPADIEAFLKQFQLNEHTMTEIEREFKKQGRNALKRYKFNADDISEFEKRFKNGGRDAFKRRCKFTDQEMEQIEEDISKKIEEIQVQIPRKGCKRNWVQFQETTDWARESLVRRFKLSEGEIKEVEKDFTVFGREALMQKYKLRDTDMAELKNTIQEFKQYRAPIRDTSSVIVAVMSHGRNGNVLGNVLNSFRTNNLIFYDVLFPYHY